MTPLPRLLIDGFPKLEREAIETWWASLEESDRERICRLCDERADSCWFGMLDEEMPEFPKVVGGHFLPDDETLDDVGRWDDDRFNYLLNHPELVIVWDPPRRTFHIGCVAHRDARACWRSSAVPAGFSCPFERPDCLMHPFLGRQIAWRHGNCNR